MNEAEKQEIVFNEASVGHVLGYTIVWWLLLVFCAVPILKPPSILTVLPLWGSVLYVIMTMLPLGYLIYIFFYVGKSVTVLNDEIIIELWLSEILHLNLKKRIRWNEIQRAEYKTVGAYRGSTDLLHLYTSGGRFTFWSMCFDVVELRQFRAILTKRLGGDRINVARSGR